MFPYHDTANVSVFWFAGLLFATKKERYIASLLRSEPRPSYAALSRAQRPPIVRFVPIGTRHR